MTTRAFRVGSVLLPVLLAAAVWAGPIRRGDLPQVGVLDARRHAAVLQMIEVKDLVDAEDAHKREKWAESLRLYQAFEKTVQAEPKAHIVLPHVWFMEGVCLLRQDKFEDARALFQKTVQAAPKDADGTLADYYIGTSYKFADQNDKAIAHYEAYVRNPDRLQPYGDFYDKAVTWLLQQYRPKRFEGGEFERRYFEILAFAAQLKPTGPEWFEVYEHHKSKGNWDECLRIAKFRMKEDEARRQVFADVLDKAQTDYGAAPAAARESARKAAAQTISEQRQKWDAMAALPADARRALLLKLVEAGAKCDCAKEAAELMMEWQKKYPEDRVAFFAYSGYLAGRPTDFSAYSPVAREYLKNRRGDPDALDVYVKLARENLKERAEVVRSLADVGGREWDYAELYRDWQNDKAEEYYRKVMADPKEGSEKKKLSAGWLGMQAYAAKKYAAAVPFLDQAVALEGDATRFRDRTSDWRHALADSWEQTGSPEKAGPHWVKNLDRRLGTRDPVRRAQSSYFGAQYLLSQPEWEKKFEGERLLRELLGQTHDILEIRLSDNPQIKECQVKAQDLCRELQIKLDQPARPERWRKR